jgi:hypothetical protein
MTTYTTKRGAAAAARRLMKSIHGTKYQAKSGVDFITSRALYSFEWKFEILNEAAHRAHQRAAA